MAGQLEKTLEEGSIIVNRTLGELLTNPSADTLLETGIRMIVMGTRDELDMTEALSRNSIKTEDDT
ncbi:MAG: TrkA C-terminal domain-containing protein [Anaerolineae bacterium]|nr:TrkA C-terminal domain-containing protein [Anaerolineae bacterium]